MESLQIFVEKLTIVGEEPNLRKGLGTNKDNNLVSLIIQTKVPSVLIVLFLMTTRQFRLNLHMKNNAGKWLVLWAMGNQYRVHGWGGNAKLNVGIFHMHLSPWPFFKSTRSCLWSFWPNGTCPILFNMSSLSHLEGSSFLKYFMYTTFIYASLSAFEAVLGLDVMHNYASFPGFLYSSNYSQSVPTQIK